MNAVERERLLYDLAFRYMTGKIDYPELDRTRRQIERDFMKGGRGGYAPVATVRGGQVERR